jgi:hypothetical protein
MKLYTEEQVRSLLNKMDIIYSLEDLTPIELPSDEEIKQVKVIKDESGHWYIIPNKLVKEFYKDESNEDMIDSGEFGNKWGGYMTGGGLNLVQLYAKKQILNQNK